MNALQRWKSLVRDADRAANSNGGAVPQATADEVQQQFNVLVASNDNWDGAQAEFLPYLLLSRWGERAYSKPRGYAGDYVMLTWLYENEAQGVGRIGPLIDRCLLDQPAGRAVRNRRGLVSKAIESHGRGAKIASLACGPATEISDVVEEGGSPDVSLVDLDIDALGAAQLNLYQAGGDYARRHHANLIHMALGRHTLPIDDQNLVYSIGLIDYFSDNLVVGLLNAIHDMLRPDGEVMLGNFHPRNPTRALMEHVLDWKLIHRTEEDMTRLFQASKFACVPSIEFEEEGINLFARARK